MGPLERGPVEETDIVVVGAGASGLWAARELVADHEVLVVDAGALGGGASGHAAGFVSGFEDWAPYPEGLVHAMDAFRAFHGTHGFEFIERPYVQLAETEAEANRLQEAFAPLLDHETYRIEYLPGEDLEARWPGRFTLESFHGGLVTESGGIVDPVAYLDALAADIRDRGVELVTHTLVENILVNDDEVTGVEVAGTRNGLSEGETTRICADVVVCAAGARTDVLVEPFVDLPIRQFTYSSARVTAPGSMCLDAYPMAYGRDIWWRPEPSMPGVMLVSGGTYFLSERDRPPREPPTEFFETVESRLPEMIPEMERVEFVSGSAHTCPTGTAITPDALPIIDEPVNAPAGLIVATAVTGGISMSSLTGSIIQSVVTGDDSPVDVNVFNADRFGNNPGSFHVHDIAEMPDRFPSGTY